MIHLFLALSRINSANIVSIDSANDLTHDLSLISKCAFKQKILFNSDSTKPAQEVISRTKSDSPHPDIFFNDISVKRASNQEHVGIYLNEKLNFKMYIETVLCKINKGISVIKKQRYTLLSTKCF